MKSKLVLRTPTALALLFGTLTSPLSIVFGQGSLTPPGAPGPSMRSLEQIEPRTPIASAPFTVSAPGSYYLTTNLTVSSGDAITIATNGVTLDLNGFTISSTAYPAASTAVLLSAIQRDVAILNGFIQGGVTNDGAGVYTGPGFGSGISYTVSYPGVAPANVRVTGVSVSGCQHFGIDLASSDTTLVEDCLVRTAGNSGIVAFTIKSCVGLDTGDDAISGDLAADCNGQSSSGAGVAAATALNCHGASVSGNGITAFSALNCLGQSVSGNGVSATTVHNCYGQSSGSGYGLYAYETAMGCYGSSSSGTGLYALNAAFCTGSRSGGIAIQATIANGCFAESGATSITYKYNMP